MSYDPRIVSELSDIIEKELKSWPGYRINKGREKPFEVIRHIHPDEAGYKGNCDIRVMATFAKRDEAVAAMQRLPIEAAVRHMLARIEELGL